MNGVYENRGGTKVNYTKYTLVFCVVVAMIVASIYGMRSCNTVIEEVTKNVPVIGTIVDKIEKKIPQIIGGKKPPAVILPDDKKDPVLPPDPRPSHFMINPRIDAGLGFGTTMTPSKLDLIPKVGVGVSIFSYGKSKMDTKFRFVRVGVQTNFKQVEATLSPIMIRLGGEKHAIFSNTYIYPYIGYNVQKNAPSVGIGISLSF
jgi:hypothetical protein